MAKKEEAPKKVLERTYVVPLRREWLKSPNWKRTKKAALALRQFLVRHMKPEGMDPKNVKIGKWLNEELWKHGIRKPPCKVKITATKDEKGIVLAELVGAPKEEVEEGKKAVKKKEKKEEKKVKEAEEKKEEKKEEEKTKQEIEKEEMAKELPATHEHPEKIEAGKEAVFKR